MKTSKKAAAAGLLFVLIAGVACPVHAAKYKINWYLGHPVLDYFEEAAANFKKVVETGSHGDIEVTIITASDGLRGAAAQSPTSPEIAAMVERGDAEMGHSFTDVMGPIAPQFYAFEAPYLFRDYRHMEGVIEGPLGAEMLDGLRAHHMVGLSFTYSGGSSGVATAERELRGPEDLKGLKVGVYGDAVNEAWLTSLGATPVAFQHNLSDIQDLKRKGDIDAVVITWRNFERTALYQDFKYFSLPSSTYLVSVTYINEKFFKSLPAAYQTLITDASRDAGRIERAKTIQLNALAKREMMGKGVRPVYLTEEGQSRFKNAVKPAYAAIEDLVGKKLIEKIKSTGDGPEQLSVPVEFAHR
jgi:TRAP-type C4-dicarboxylate transport system substrate-binding protein